jgi:hypothetical protein
MLTIKELRSMARSLPPPAFRRQIGPFALVQRPMKDGVPDAELATTQMAKPDDISKNSLSLLFEFEDLSVATLPPLQGVDELSVGRLPDCDLVLEHPSVSKRHAVLKWNEKQQRCMVKDVGSTNGTFLNASSMIRGETNLRDGDIVSFGDVQFWFLLTDTLLTRLGGEQTQRFGVKTP